MKTISNLLRRLKRPSAKPKSKKGASLALVMIIGALLVIWVMCIMPLMATTGNAANKTMDGYLDYLQNRSSIEFCKSELLKMSEKEIPHTFAVIVENGKYRAIPNKVNGATNSPMGEDAPGTDHYTRYVVDTDPDNLDKPTNDADGNKVTAICSVVPTEDYEKFEILITTYNQGVPGMSYRVEFKSEGSLKIYPEAYRNNSALPLSDFVVVDGWYGPFHAWDSSITMGNATSLGFVEHLLQVKDPSETPAGYADTGMYPAVFKNTANTALEPDADNDSFATPIPNPVYSNEKWFMPEAAKNNKYDETEGRIWYETGSDGKFHIWMYDPKASGKKTEITDRCVIYLNSRVCEAKAVPANGTGIFKITIDYSGTDHFPDDDELKYDENKINVLPIAGLVLNSNTSNPNPIDRISDQKHTINPNYAPQHVIKNEIKNAEGVVTGYTYDVVLAYNAARDTEDGLLYGYVNANAENPQIVWSDKLNDNVIRGLSGNPGDAYYFYVCKPASFVNGVFYSKSDVVSAGMLFVPQYISDLKSGSYFIMNSACNAALVANGASVQMDSLRNFESFILATVSNSSDLNAYGWSVSKNGDNTTFMNNSTRTYLSLTGTPNVTFNYRWRPEKHKTGKKESHNCYAVNSYNPCTFNGFDYSISLGSQDKEFQVTNTGIDFTIKRFVSETVTYHKFEGCTYEINNPTYTTNSFTETAVLNLGGNPISASKDSTATVKFATIPRALPEGFTPTTPGVNVSSFPSNKATIEYPTNALNYIREYINNENAIVYANGEVVEGVLNAGVYDIVVSVGGRYARLGTLTVNKTNLANEVPKVTLSGSAAINAESEIQVDVTASGWHTNGGYHYFGFKKTSDSKYNWYAVNDVNYSFTLDYGDYNIFVKESGSNNYNSSGEIPVTFATAAANADKNVVKVTMKDLDTSDYDPGDFKFIVDDEGKVTWYKLPEGLNPKRVHIAFCYKFDYRYGVSTRWSYTCADSKEFNIIFGLGDADFTRTKQYGVTIDGTKYDPPKGDDGKDGINERYVLNIGEAIPIELLNGHVSSMMKGRSLYFMGRGTSIDTYGVPVYLTTDLLVLNSDITGRHADSDLSTYGVWVTPYTTSGNNIPNNTMLFAVNNIKNSSGQVIFNAKKFYTLPPNTNLEALTPSDINPYPQENETLDPKKIYEIGGPTDSRVRNLFRGKVYPEINMDICYASREQLARIISGETIGWTDKGVLNVNSSATNQNYCVPMFVTKTDGNSSFKANRILIAARTPEGDDAFKVDHTLSITARYLSVDAQQIAQGGNCEYFKLYNLGQDKNFIQILSNLLKITNYSSKTLQMDYERSTTITTTGNGNKTMSPQICRYSDGVDLFELPSSAQLMATYTVDEVEGLFTGGLSGLSATVKTVDRYIEIVPSENDTSINISSLLSAQWDVYANYVYFSPRISSISMSSLLESNLRFSSQESGYTTNEYLGLFKSHSADSYAGTLIYFGQDPKGTEYITITLGSDTYQIPRGHFYYLNSEEYGTSIATLAAAIKAEEEGVENPYKATEEELAKIKVYINIETGQLSGAYVDTGLDDNTASSVGGFSGGSVG